MARIKGKLTTSDYLPIKEFNRLVDGLHEDEKYMWELYCRISFCTALRASDVRSLRWEDVLERDFLDIVEKKTKKSRRITFNPSVREKLSELHKLLGSPAKENHIFSNQKTNKPYTLEHINRTLKRFKCRYELLINAFSTHTFRKSFGRYVYESKGKSAESLILLNSIFRHSSINITKVYIGLRQAEIDSVFNSIKF